ncbi:MAG TPA: Uma2 family endonuclease [Oscillatoriaceae cyanobacterium M33_DOE_052]|uniref:Uma2 family endonuclease n=1 Tax=Planktothricoides sp. SpSt-374 TaxID=2282167 RepID=A0A7C3VG18_9CYAN|nr:Uma2 family endonuclease [Oscillatoriaceae cyanobacterium M33_DOE_052]
MVTATIPETISLADFLAHPAEHMEWVDGQLVETKGMTVKHSVIQSKLSSLWRNYISQSPQSGEVAVELPCRTKKQGRRPDVSYLTPELVTQFGNATSLPQSPPLIAEIASPDDAGDELLLKAQEYLDSGCQEVWLVFPEARRVLVMTANQTFGFNPGETVTTKLLLPGFAVALDELFG